MKKLLALLIALLTAASLAACSGDEPNDNQDNLDNYLEEEVVIDLPHPRNVSDPEFVKYRTYVTDQIKWW